MLIAALAMVMFGCKENPYIASPGSDNDQIPDTIPSIADPDPSPDPEGITIPEGTISVNEAVDIAKSLPSGGVTTKTYYIKGWVVGFDRGDSFEKDFPIYGNDFVYLSARQDGYGLKRFYCYRLLGPNGAKLPDLECILYGDFIVIQCKITNYSDVYENSGDCWAMMSTNEHFKEKFGDVKPAETIYATCAEARAAALALASGSSSTDIYVVEGYVQSKGYDATISKGQQKFIWMDDKLDGNQVFEAYYCNVPDGTTPVPVGTKIRVTGHVMNYKGTPEIKNGDIEILSE